MATEGNNDTNDQEAPPPYKEEEAQPTKADGDGGDAEKTDNNDSGGGGDGAAAFGDGLFAQPRWRIIAMSVAIIFYALFSMVFWGWQLDLISDSLEFCDGVEGDACDWVRTQGAGFALLTIGMVFLMITSALAIIVAFKPIKCVGLIVLILAILATLFSVVGYFCAISELADSGSTSVTTDTDAENMVNATKAARFLEIAIVCATAIVLGLDCKIEGFLNDNMKRAILMSAAFFAVLGFAAGVCYAMIADYYGGFAAGFGVSIPDDEFGCVAAGWIMLALFAVIRILVIEIGVVPLGPNPMNTMIAGLVVAILTIIGGFICAVGYWAIIDYFNDMKSLCEQFSDECTGYDENNCGLFAPSAFILIMAVVNAFDMGLIAKCKMAGQAGSAAK